MPNALKGQCGGPLQQLPAPIVEELLNQAAIVRFRRKAAQIEARSRQRGWDQALWEDLRTISMVVSERQVAGEESTTDVRYYIGSKPGKAKEYAGYIRGHWGIENSLHWILDMAFDEDRSRIRKDHGQENLALLRRLAVSVLKNAKSCPGSIRTKQLQAILDDEVLRDMLNVFSGG